MRPYTFTLAVPPGETLEQVWSRTKPLIHKFVHLARAFGIVEGCRVINDALKLDFTWRSL